MAVAVDPETGFPDRDPAPPKPAVEAKCDVCGKVCGSAQALIQHKRSHTAGAKPKEFKTAAQQVNETLVALIDQTVAAASPEEFASGLLASLVDTVVKNSELEAQTQMRATSLERERDARRNQRESSAGAPGELRRGSKRRASYSPVQKLKALEVYDRLCKDPSVTNKPQAWEEATGIPQSNIKGKTGWADPMNCCYFEGGRRRDAQASLAHRQEEPPGRQICRDGAGLV